MTDPHDLSVNLGNGMTEASQETPAPEASPLPRGAPRKDSAPDSSHPATSTRTGTEDVAPWPSTLSQADSPAKGHVVAGYQILEELGRGGMGVVYKAQDPKEHRIVALKMIRAEDQANPDALVRFRQEAETLSRLKHENIVEIYEVGEYQGMSFFALEYRNLLRCSNPNG